jgi:hypothetical protein
MRALEVRARTPRIGVGPHGSARARFGDLAVRNTATKKSNRESGYGLVFAAIAMVVLLGAAGFSVDFGYLRYQRRLLQAAADSAALAGAAQLGAGGGSGQAVTAAKADSQLNGFQDGSGNVVVTATPTVATNTMLVQVSNTYPTFFMRVFGGSLSSVTVSTSATARYIGGRGCIYALTGGGGITVSGGRTVNVPNCNVFSNQGISGGGTIIAAAVGSHNASSFSSTPTIVTGMQRTSDPLSYLTAPGAPGGTCPTISYTNTDNKFGAQTITPGKYCGISFSTTYSQNVTFSPGNYYITGGGGLSFKGSGHVSGTGVFFYVNSGSVTFSNTQRIRLVAPTGGTRPGILIFQPASNGNAATIDGSNNGIGSKMQGALYFPNATLTMSGAGNNAAYMLLVAKTLNLNTNINFASDYTSLPNGYSPVRTAALIQ